MDRHLHPHQLGTLVLLAAALAVAVFAPGFVLLVFGVGVGLLVGTVLLGALAFWMLRRRVDRLLQGRPLAAVRVVDSVVVEVR